MKQLNVQIEDELMIKLKEKALKEGKKLRFIIKEMIIKYLNS